MRKIVLSTVLALAATAAAAQGDEAAKKPTSKPAPAKPATAKPATAKPAAAPATGPSKVTGEGTKTASGLQYWDVKTGTGKEAQNGDSVMVNYTGWLTNGQKFDSSIGRAPFEVSPLGSAPVIKGWNEGIVGMKVGGKRQLHIPPDLAYGQRGFPGAIPPNSTLIFDVELLSIK